MGIGSISAFSQQLITAKIINAKTQAAVNSAVITLKGNTPRSYSNKLGFFQLTADSTDFLIISHTEYETGTIQVPSKNQFVIQLNPLAAVEALQQVPDNWLPALLDHKVYPTRFVMPFVFLIKGKSTEKPITIDEGTMPIATYLDEFVITAMGR